MADPYAHIASPVEQANSDPYAGFSSPSTKVVRGGVLDKLGIADAPETKGGGPRTGDALKPFFGGHNPVAETYDLMSGALNPSSDRPLSERAVDAVNFVASVPLKALRLPSPGEISETLTGNPAHRQSEQRFVENNPELLRAMEIAGSAGAVAPMGQGFIAPASPSLPLGTTRNAPIAAARARAIAEDSAAFERQGVREFGPAYNQGPVASVAKQLSETPVIGGPLKNNLDESIIGAAQAVERTADNLGDARTFDQAGNAVQRGLERYRSDGLQQMEPGVVQRLDIAPEVQGPAHVVMSQGAERVANQAAPIRERIGSDVTQTTRGAEFAGGRPSQLRDRFLARRTGVEDVDEAHLDNIIRTPASQTSFATRSEALYEKAWRQIPALMRENNTVNPNLVNPTNTRMVLDQVQGQIGSMIAGQTTLNGPLVERLTNARSNITLGDLRAIRTEVGRALGSSNPLQQTLNRQQLMGLYGAISRDIEIGLDTIANRAAVGTARGNNAPNYVSPDMARQAGQALRAFRTADRYFRAGQDRLERVYTILQADNPERAAQRLLSAAVDGGRGNIGLVQSVRGALRPEEWGQVSALALRELGKPVASARGTAHEAGFSVSSFMTRWNKMDERARAMLFDGPQRQAIDDVVRISSRLAEVEATFNTSRSATNALNVGGLFAAGGAVMAGDGGATLLGSALAGSGAAVLMSRPAYAKWMARYARLRADARIRSIDGPTPQIASHIRALGVMTASDAEARAVAEDVAHDNGVSIQKPAPKTNMPQVDAEASGGYLNALTRQ